ncbi:ankyrin repeat domain-containing protein [Falsihalocynthiibacter arcticus]|uniref:ankyrin repeat domain-containing protein n=1 Tax=Falsihalocynthiibacter arcticus TaxID=1579316 RepID=UPI001F256CE8|nr:ankyrin repeat domain-containing protein [Falsihalocynthiibacter arcticus]
MEAVVLGNGGADHVRTVQILVEAGADISLSDRDGVTPLQHARSQGYAEIVSLLE